MKYSLAVITFTISLIISFPLFSQEPLRYSLSRSTLSNLPTVNNGKHILAEGDIIFPKNRSAAGKRETLWKDGVFVYKLDPAYDYGAFKRFVWDALLKIHTQTNITVKERTNEQDYVLFTGGDQGCYSRVGRVGGQQIINLSPKGCLQVGTVLHEIFHALGVFHEQSRFDRDNHIKIIRRNIVPQMLHNFDIVRHAGIGSYDFNSIMHYGSDAFSIGPNSPTIVKYDGSLIRANRSHLTKKDIDGLNELYKNEILDPNPTTTTRPGPGPSLENILKCDRFVSYQDKIRFETKLSKYLKRFSGENTCIEFKNRYKIETLPDRLKKWISAVDSTDGKVEYIEVSRGFFSKLIKFIVRIFTGSKEIDYSPANDYHIMITVDKVTKNIIHIIFYPRTL
jgi:hypothetical protein